MRMRSAAWLVRLGLGVVAWGMGGAARPASAQPLPSEPIAFADGRVTIGGDVSASYGSEDIGFFNYTDYEHSALRLFRVDVTAAVRAGDHLALLGEVRTENLGAVRPYALYLRIRPWTDRALDIQVGRVPPTFGAFARRSYVADNLLIGYPLAYQYLTTLRPDALPASADELLTKRGLGWLVRYTVGSTAADHGVPLVSGFTWDTGVQVHVGSDRLNATASVTSGTVSNPLFKDDNSGKQVAARIEGRPLTGLVVGTSFARGPFVSDAAARAANDGRSGDFTQTAWGADVEYSRGYYLLRAETIVSAWRMPVIKAPAIGDPLWAVSESIEGRYKIATGFYVAGRFDHLGFSDVAGTLETEPWDAPVSRVEVGGGYSIRRNIVLKVSRQHDWRDGGRLVTHTNQNAVQLVYWF